MKKIILVDMDGVLVKEPTIEHINDALFKLEIERPYNWPHWSDIPGIFKDLEPIDGAIDAYNQLSKDHELYIVSTAAWNNPSSFTDKRLWIEKHLPVANRRLFLTHNKHMVVGDFLIDDRLVNGAEKFPGKHIHFGQEEFKDWDSVLAFFSNL